MKGEIYIINAATPEDHLSNCMFQAGNVNGWLSAGDRESARIKAECLLHDAELLVAAFEAEERAKGNAS